MIVLVRSSPLSDLAANVRLLREERAWSQAQLAARAGLDVRQVQRIEQGTTDIGVIHLSRIARALGVELGPLFVPRPFVPRPRGRPAQAKRTSATELVAEDAEGSPGE